MPLIAESSPFPLFDLARSLSQDGELCLAALQKLKKASKAYATPKGRVTPELQSEFFKIEKAFGHKFDPLTRGLFQEMIAETGGRLLSPIEPPIDSTPFWLQTPSDLEGFRSTASLPETADYVVIGAGLTGASTASNLILEAAQGKTVVLIESGMRPAWGASGRNGGNIEAMKESFLHHYRGFVEAQKDFLREKFRDLDERDLQKNAERQAKVLLEFSRDNVRIVKKLITENQLKVDASFDGWLRIPTSPEEAHGLHEEVEFAHSLGMGFEIWSSDKILEKTGIKTQFSGRFIQESGNFHPGKFVDALVKDAVAGGVLFYTQSPVSKITPLADGTYEIAIAGETICSKKIVVAANVSIPEILEGTEFIEPRVSHLLNFEHQPNVLKARYTVTTDNGDLYWNYPISKQYQDEDGLFGMLHIGGGLDTPVSREEIDQPPFVRDIFDQVRKRTVQFTPVQSDQPPIRAWSGLMGFTQDRMPVISFYVDPNGATHKGIIVAFACNGYGGSQCAIAGERAAEIARSGEIPTSMPDDVFSMKRFLTPIPLFENTQNSGASETHGPSGVLQ